MTHHFDHMHSLPRRAWRPLRCRFRRRLTLHIAAALLTTATSATATDAIEGGYEIHRQGEVPTAREVAHLQVPGAQGVCAREGIPFRFSGDLDTVGNFEIIEHHHPGLRKSSIVTRRTELTHLSLCHLEVRQRQVTRISHYGEKARTVFTHEIDPRVGSRPWGRRTDPHLDRETIDLLREALSLDNLVPQELRAGDVTVATAPGLDKDRIAGRECHWVHTPPPLESHSCMLREGIGMPINESLSAEYGGVVDGRPIVLIRSKVVRFDGPIAIPSSVFEPGEHTSLDDPPPNATTKWCAQEAARTGTNPCADADDGLDDVDDAAFEDGDDALVTHFNALIQEWCAVEAKRSGGTPCHADGPGLSDPRIRQSMAAWCAEEATRTGVNRCERGSHARTRD
ncbi:hypothetical protein [Thauera sp.]|jgi:hypothetical protein|uniref:hypothetical protein n=1 Tax=Thauera sp. TaxID=1905334 RepID=UPI002A35E1CD|nr:hypothetical protein [Thauera sp.]MDX9886891.1 hypothetical protein [Thauera sp.]